MILVNRELKPKDGDMGTVEIDGEATLKYIYFGNSNIDGHIRTIQNETCTFYY